MAASAISYRGVFAKLVPLVILATLAFLVFMLQSAAIDHSKSQASDEKIDAVLSVGKSLPSFGYRNLLADLLWLRFVQYYGDVQARERTGYRYSYEYLNLITDRDPRFEKAYLFANLAVTYQMVRTDLSEKLLLKGIAHNPKSYQIWQARGFLHFLYTGDLPKAAYAFRKNAGLAVSQEGNAKQQWANYWINIARSIELPNVDTRYTRRKIWEEIFNSALDRQTRRMALVYLNTLGVRVDQDGHLQEIFPLYPPTGFAKLFVYGPPSPKGQHAIDE
jgi:hypothetical protein